MEFLYVRHFSEAIFICLGVFGELNFNSALHYFNKEWFLCASWNVFTMPISNVVRMCSIIITTITIDHIAPDDGNF